MGENEVDRRYRISSYRFEEDEAVVDPLQHLDTLFTIYNEEATFEVAEQTYVDLLEEDVEDFHHMTFYTDRELEDIRGSMPDSVFEELPDGYDAYELLYDEMTVRLKFGETHGETYELDSDEFSSIEIRAPTLEAFYRKWIQEEQERLEC